MTEGSEEVSERYETAPESRLPLTVIVPTGNRRDVIADCLTSVRWADEILVVDSFSDDGTFELAEAGADRVLQHEYGYSALQKNWAIPQASHEWILIVDTDERVPAALKEEIEEVLDRGTDHAAFRIPRVNLVLGRPLRGAGYYPDSQIRLFRRDLARYELRRVHAHMQVEGTTGDLSAPLIHYAHRSIDQTLSNLILLMSGWEAEARMEGESRVGRLSSLRSLWAMMSRGGGAFVLRYFAQGGWRDGAHGFVVSVVWSLYVAVTYMKVWESQLDLPDSWWESDWKLRQSLPQDRLSEPLTND